MPPNAKWAFGKIGFSLLGCCTGCVIGDQTSAGCTNARSSSYGIVDTPKHGDIHCFPRQALEVTKPSRTGAEQAVVTQVVLRPSERRRSHSQGPIIAWPELIRRKGKSRIHRLGHGKRRSERSGVGVDVRPFIQVEVHYKRFIFSVCEKCHDRGFRTRPTDATKGGSSAGQHRCIRP